MKESRLKSARKERRLTLEKLSEMTGISISYLQRMEKGTRGRSEKNIKKIAEALGMPPGSLIDDTQEPRMVPLVGYVGAGSEALLFADGQGPFDEVEAPDGATEMTVAVEVRGESLGALFDRWLVFYDDVRDPPGGDQIGHLCVCGLADGRILVKKLIRGQLPGHFTLLSNVEPPIYDAIVEWAARVKTMTPR